VTTAARNVGARAARQFNRHREAVMIDKEFRRGTREYLWFVVALFSILIYSLVKTGH
jgi:hypothetical protein